MAASTFKKSALSILTTAKHSFCEVICSYAANTQRDSTLFIQPETNTERNARETNLT